MKISYDEECDAMSITFKETTVTTRRVAEGVALEFDAEGHLAGIKILDAVQRFGTGETLRKVLLETSGRKISVPFGSNLNEVPKVHLHAAQPREISAR